MNTEDAPEGESDHDLVLRAQNGDVEAYDQLMLRHQGVIAAQMRRFSPSPEVVEDLTQTAFVEAYQALSGYRPVAPFLNWLRTIASRVGYRYWRQEDRRVKFVPYHGNEEILAGKSPKEDPGVETRFAELVGFMEKLKPTERQILYLIYVDGLSIADAAASMGWNRAATKMRVFRARMKLRSLLKSEDSGYLQE